MTESYKPKKKKPLSVKERLEKLRKKKQAYLEERRELNKELGLSMKTLREKLGLSLADCAERLKITKLNLWNLENGHQNWTWTTYYLFTENLKQETKVGIDE